MHPMVYIILNCSTQQSICASVINHKITSFQYPYGTLGFPWNLYCWRQLKSVFRVTYGLVQIVYVKLIYKTKSNSCALKFWLFMLYFLHFSILQQCLQSIHLVYIPSIRRIVFHPSEGYLYPLIATGKISSSRVDPLDRLKKAQHKKEKWELSKSRNQLRLLLKFMSQKWRCTFQRAWSCQWYTKESMMIHKEIISQLDEFIKSAFRCLQLQLQHIN